MTKAVIIGIDPGAHGGIAMLTDGGDVVWLSKMPATPAEIHEYLKDFVEMCRHDDIPVSAYLEDVGHGIPGQSSSATAKFARHCGHLEMCLIALGVPTVTVTPNKWQKTYQLGRSSEYSKTEWKNRLKAKAQQLFPHYTKAINLATADALLIAEYGRKQQ